MSTGDTVRCSPVEIAGTGVVPPGGIPLGPVPVGADGLGAVGDRPPHAASSATTVSAHSRRRMAAIVPHALRRTEPVSPPPDVGRPMAAPLLKGPPAQLTPVDGVGRRMTAFTRGLSVAFEGAGHRRGEAAPGLRIDHAQCGPNGPVCCAHAAFAHYETGRLRPVRRVDGPGTHLQSQGSEPAYTRRGPVRESASQHVAGRPARHGWWPAGPVRPVRHQHPG